jgi:hypothetical protein
MDRNSRSGRQPPLWQKRNKRRIIMDTDYEKAKKEGLVQTDRWTEGIPHHPESRRLMEFLSEIDFNDYDDHFCWKLGGDGDNGEALMYQMDAYFELKDIIERKG